MRNDYLIPALNRLVNQTEKIYMRFAQSYFKLMKELEISISSSSEYLESNGTMDDSWRAFDTSTHALTHDTRRFMEKKSENFTRIHARDDVLFQEIDNSIGYIFSLKEEIDKVKDLSEDMWLMALNAMTAGIKAGKAGGAFPVITGEFTNNSRNTMNEMQEIINCGNTIEERLSVYKVLVEKVKTDQLQLIQKFSSHLSAGFEKFDNELHHIISTFKSIADRSRSVQAPLYSIMEEIQQQDIIRQSIDQVILSISAFEESNSVNGNSEDRLDNLAFRKTISDLCNSLLDDVLEIVSGNRLLFKSRSEEVRKIIIAVENERINFVESGKNGSKAGNEGLERPQKTPPVTMEDLVSDIELLMRSKELIKKQSSALMRDVKNIENKFGSFAALVSRYRNINLLYRIEVEKQPSLHNMKNNVDQIVELTDRMESHIERMLNSTKKFIKLTANTLYEYENIFKQDALFLEDFKQSIRDGLAQITDLRTGLEKSVVDFSLFTGGFFEIFHETTMDIDTLEELIGQIDDIKKIIHQVYTTSDEQLNNLLEIYGLDEWNVTNDKMMDVIEGFTIFRHKKKAGEIADFAIEDGTEAGVLTLF